MMFSAMLTDAFRHSGQGVHIRYRTDGKLFKLCRFQAVTKVKENVLRDVLFADDCSQCMFCAQDAGHHRQVFHCMRQLRPHNNCQKDVGHSFLVKSIYPKYFKFPHMCKRSLFRQRLCGSQRSRHGFQLLLSPIILTNAYKVETGLQQIKQCPPGTGA